MSFIACILGTLLIGTLAGWIGHWALHQRWTGRFAKAHLVHHRLYPPSNFLSESYRDAKESDTTLVLGPFITVVVLLWMGTLVLLGAPWFTFVAIVIVGVLVGGLHEYVHKAIHLKGHWLGTLTWFQAIQIHHLKHHKHTQKNLGIVWYGWDRLFRTFK